MPKPPVLRDVLLEVRIENIPARFITSAEEQIEKAAEALLKEANLPYSGLKAYGTYKRLVLKLSGVPAKSSERAQKSYGPSAKLLRDAAGNYTPQVLGFARARGTTPDKLGVETVPNKGEVLVFETRVPGRPAAAVLAEIFPKVIAGLQFPKTMVWEETRVRFARPVRSLLALHGEKIVSFSFAGVKSGRLTVGLSAKGSRQISVASAEKYFKALENANVLVDDKARAETLDREIAQVAKRMKLEVAADPELVKENLYLVEYPVCVVGGFSQEFLKLPAELVQLVMNKQLKFFTVNDAKGRLQPYFVGIRDGVSKGQKNVEEGFRNVMEARFRDAVFFFSRDLAEPLDDFRKKLETITFQGKLGTMADKTARVEKLAAWLLANCGTPVNGEDVAAAAAHVYSDLTTGVVKEFPELQGTMGYYYAKNSGMNENVSRAVGQFYWPVSAKSPLPSSKEGALVSLAGKLDTLAADFFLDLIPSGSADPHGLRRQALGLVRIVLENGFRLNLKTAVGGAFAALPGGAASKAQEALMDFIWLRAEGVFAEAGFKFDEIRAVREFFMREGDLVDCRDRIKDLHAVRSDPDFGALAMAFKRAKNILRQAKAGPGAAPDEAVFDNDAERRLYSDIQALSGKLKEYISARDYAKGLSELVSIKPDLDAFFEKVMVMVEDARVKENRLRLIGSLVALFEGVADLGQLQ